MTLFLNPAQAARRLGVSPKALRLYEQRGLIAPGRTPAGWRAYGPGEMARAAEVVALRQLGLSLAQVARVLAGDPQDLEPALAAHQAILEGRARQVSQAIDKVRALRAGIAQGRAPAAAELASLVASAAPVCAFDLPWPWGGERFELPPLRPLTWLIGPLGSGKTRLAQAIAEALPGAGFLGLDRAGAPSLPEDSALAARVAAALAWLVEDGAQPSDPLTTLLNALEAEAPAVLVVDLVEQDLDHATQEALVAHLRRRRAAGARPLILMTRSTAMLDLAAVGPDETILFCPANHSPPTWVAAVPGAPGYEAVATCLASPEVRARTAGVVAFRPAGA